MDWANEPNQTTTNTGDLEERLGRLSNKTGVIATIIIDRHSGSIIKTSGNVDALRPRKNVSGDGAPTTSSKGTSFAGPDDLRPAAEITDTESEGLQSFARAIWTFAHNSEALIKDQDPAVSQIQRRIRPTSRCYPLLC